MLTSLSFNEYDGPQIIAEEKLYFVSEDENLAAEEKYLKSCSKFENDNWINSTQAIIQVNGRIMLSKYSSTI